MNVHCTCVYWECCPEHIYTCLAMDARARWKRNNIDSTNIYSYMYICIDNHWSHLTIKYTKPVCIFTYCTPSQLSTHVACSEKTLARIWIMPKNIRKKIEIIKVHAICMWNFNLLFLSWSHEEEEKKTRTLENFSATFPHTCIHLYYIILYSYHRTPIKKKKIHEKKLNKSISGTLAMACLR